MCGIAGWLAAPRPALNEGSMAAMLQSIAHRGPDGEGIHVAYTQHGRQVFLGHRRLAIIDPDGAKQPMRDAAAGLAIVFNGEIYNFRELRKQLIQYGWRFQRDSDTEVLLRAYQHWGEDMVQRLRGMFAFAIWDARRQRLMLARDRFGEKPLFLRESADGLFFASEIKALLRIPRWPAEVDPGAVHDYLAYRYVPGPHTLLCGIRKLAPGTVLTWEAGTQRETRYWSPPDRRVRVPLRTPRDAVGDFLTQLDEAVKIQMVSDVPFGAFLSGGLDSSMIVALMARHCRAVKTFSIGFDDDRYSELPYAAEVARVTGSEHCEIVVSHKDILAHLPRLVAARDAPVSEPSDIPIYLLAREAARSVKMILTGEGSDEILGGYPKHVVERFATPWQLLPRVLRERLAAPLVHALPYGFRRAKTALANLNIEDWRERQVRWFGALDQRERERLCRLRPRAASAADGPPFDVEAGNSSLRRMLYFDQTSWLPDNLLERGDRMCMAASIENRVPFLDHELAEFVSTLPDRLRVRGLRGKWILREAARGVLPARILTRPKVGFRVPVNQWFRTGLRDYLLDHLRSADSLTRDYYDAPTLDRLLDEHLQGRQNHEKLLWSLLNLEIWQRQHAPADAAATRGTALHLAVG